MMNTIDLFRTDLAIEEQERSTQKIPGVSIHERTEKHTQINVSIVRIKSDEGAMALQKPPGTYITLSGGTITGHTDEDIQKSAMVMGKALLKLLPQDFSNLFVVGLGNADMTADALGPKTVGQLLVNRHIFPGSPQLCALTPGVMGQTGLEAVEILRGIIKETNPDALIVIDALAARSSERLLTTIQLSDTGICPGSGVGNHRSELSKKTLGIPVISVGIPTVIGAASIVWDILSKVSDEMPKEDHLLPLGTLYVTPKDIDVHIKELSTLLAEGIHHIVYKD